MPWKVSEITEQCKMDFSSQRKAKNSLWRICHPYRENLVASVHMLLGSKTPGKLETLRFSLEWVWEGNPFSQWGGKGGRSCCQEEQATLPLFSRPSEMTPNRGAWQLCHQRTVQRKAGAGRGIWAGPLHPRIVAGNQGALSCLSWCWDEFVGTASQP